MAGNRRGPLCRRLRSLSLLYCHWQAYTYAVISSYAGAIVILAPALVYSIPASITIEPIDHPFTPYII